ncbi:hypothetical protein [Sporosarcina limicola]|uniref:Uncharacterized protein n=1 Tax=Sporosarcina limicola TaxID=34101 RepID=A0A927MJW3_9BACL|nr:hypothetical protein [Sporosarcina limicola]MBE1554497.1 hypothetical protein [Sporosarcina limicola]
MEALETNIVRMIDSNGEQIGEFNRDEQYIRSRKQDDFIKKTAKVKTQFDAYNRKEGKFIWAYPAKIQYLIKSKEFTKGDLTMIFYLATYVNGTGYLSHANNKK